MNRALLIFSLVWVSIFNAAHDFSSFSDAFAAEVQVTLFGKKCLISGPFNAKELEAVHSVSPERIPPIFSSKQVHETLERLRDVKKGSVPPLFESYLERLKKRLSAIEGFYDAVDAARTAQSASVFFEKTSTWLGIKNSVELKTAIDGLIKDSSNATLKDQALDAYQKMIEADPENEFHRISKKLKIKYSCNFEEED